MRLIDADAICNECIEETLLATCEGCVIKEHKLNKSIEAEPVRHGRWEKIHYADEPVKTAYRCSVCHTTWDAPTNGCPYCRAKMNEEG